MADKKSPLVMEDPLVALGRAMAPAVNAGLRKMARDLAKPPPEDYCPGCGDLSEDAPNLCPECLAVNAHLS